MILLSGSKLRRCLIAGVMAGACALTLGAAEFSSVTSAATSPGDTRVIGATAIRLRQPIDPQLGIIAPAADAATKGMLGPELQWPVLPLHAAVARNGHVVSYGTPGGDYTKQAGILFDNWNPAAGDSAESHIDSDSMGYDSFCNSLVALADGRLLMVGGNSTMSTMVYDPRTGGLEMGPNLKHQRWYATTLRLPSGKILVLGGSDYYNEKTVQGLPPKTTTGTTPELGDGSTPWRSLTGAAVSAAFGASASHWFYPRAFNGPRGLIVGISNNQLWTLDTAGRGKVMLTGKLPFKPAASGSQVMYAPGKVLLASGGSYGPEASNAALANAVTIDFNGAKPKVRATGSVLHPGNWLNLTVLPTGKVLANGGTAVGTLPETKQLTAEVWNPATGKWHSAATAKRTRTYHSVSLLLPSGAVLTGGSGAAPHTAGGTGEAQENNLNAELYYPAYLFTKGEDGTVRWANRPAITSISGSATYGGTVHLGLASTEKITGVSLISLPSVTHSQNADQRRVPLAVQQHGRTVSFTLPKSVNDLPPGDYELTTTNSAGVPSAAQIITLRAGKPGLITLAAR